MRQAVAETLATKASGDLRVARKLAASSDIDDGVIGFHAHQAVEKSFKAVLSLNDLDFPMMAHDLDFLLKLIAQSTVETPHDLIEVGWLTPWATTYENCEASPGQLDRRHTIQTAETAVDWCRALLNRSTLHPPADPARDKPPPRPPSVPGLGRPETER
jgi:HEPN domain-containing protein